MKPEGPTPLVQRVFAVLFIIALTAYPRRFRRRFADSMLEAFIDGLEHRQASDQRRAVWALRTVVTTAIAGMAERVKPGYREPPASWAIRRERGGWVMGDSIDSMIRDLRFGVRSLARRPGFSTVVVVTLALGVGANAAIFSVVNGVLLTPLPWVESDRLIHVTTRYYEGQRGSMSHPDIVDLESLPAIGTLVGANVSTQTLTGLGDPVMLDVARPSKGLMETFKVTPHLGRDIRPDEFGPGAPPIAVISYGFWTERFGGDLDVLGMTLVLNGRTREIVGVAPAGFDFPSGTEIWIPRNLSTEGCGRGCHTETGIGRLAEGATLMEARAQADRLAASLSVEYPESNLDKGFLVTSLLDETVADVRRGLWLMLGAVGLVLLIACANVANLLLARASSAFGEMSVRAALGASRGRLARQSLVESGLLAVLGGLLGLALAQGILSLLPGLGGGQIPRLDGVVLDRTVLAFALATVVLVTFLCGLAPALTAARADALVGLHQAAGRHDGGQRHARSLLLASEVALASVLLIGAGLLLQSFRQLHALDLGYDTEGITRFSVNLPSTEYDELELVNGFYRELESRIEALPGVESVGSAWSAPLARGHATGTVFVEGRPDPTPETEREAAIHSFGPGWLRTMNMSLVRGRALRPDEHLGGEPVALVNEQFVRENFPNEDPLGRRVELGVDLGFGHRAHTLVGILADTRNRSVAGLPEAEMWVPQIYFGPGSMTVTLRTAGGVPAPIAAIREIVRELDPDLPLYRIETVEQALAREVAPARFYLALAAAFAALAAVLAAVGLYGLAAYAAARRTREIGLRVALGAKRDGIVRLVVTQGAQPALGGLIVGLAAAYMGGGILDSVLFGVRPHDPAVYVAVALLFVAVSVVAPLLPAYRASRVDPVVALRGN